MLVKLGLLLPEEAKIEVKVIFYEQLDKAPGTPW